MEAKVIISANPYNYMFLKGLIHSALPSRWLVFYIAACSKLFAFISAAPAGTFSHLVRSCLLITPKVVVVITLPKTDPE